MFERRKGESRALKVKEAAEAKAWRLHELALTKCLPAGGGAGDMKVLEGEGRHQKLLVC